MHHVGYVHPFGALSSPLAITSVGLRTGIAGSSRAALRAPFAPSLCVGNPPDESTGWPKWSTCAVSQPPDVAKRLPQPLLAARRSQRTNRPGQRVTTRGQLVPGCGQRATRSAAWPLMRPVTPWWCETITRRSARGLTAGAVADS